ncbi:FAD/NAD(P)-binding domain-containing protein [Coniochaeta sp. PMI_546]|nr:FAD/NAD(P)-binding domain-containing protein [Coniochaeta sp. PMI_546]
MGAKTLYAGYLALTFVSGTFAALDSSIFGFFEIIEKDVVIVGGGASGAHAAVRLREDYKKSVVVIEKESILGGHVDTYYGDKTGVPRDYGVQVYFPYQDAMDFIDRFNLTVTPGLAPRGDTVTKYVDFKTGKELVNFTTPDVGTEIGAIAAMYNVLTSKGYDKMIEPGFWNLPAGPDIPDDLLLPIGEFAKKYNVTAALPRMYESTGGGPAAQQKKFLNVMTLTFLQSFSPGWMQVFLGTIGLYHIEGGNQLLYTKIADLLGQDVLTNTVVLASERTDTGVNMIVSGLKGTKIIKAKKLLLAIPPTRENLIPFDLNSEETALFAKPMYGRYGTAIVSHPSLPKGVELRNMPTSAVKDPYAPFLETPHILSFSSYGNDTDLFSIGTSGNPYLLYGPSAATAVAQQNLQTMAGAGTIPSLKGKPLTVVEWSDHGPGGFGVTAADMRAGWMSKMYGLQGKRSTWFTGNAIAIDFSTQLWKMNDEVLKRMIAAW